MIRPEKWILLCDKQGCGEMATVDFDYGAGIFSERTVLDKLTSQAGWSFTPNGGHQCPSCTALAAEYKTPAEALDDTVRVAVDMLEADNRCSIPLAERRKAAGRLKRAKVMVTSLLLKPQEEGNENGR